MATTFAEPGLAGRVVLRGVSWDVYESLLREIGDQHLYLTYDQGDLEIMSPSIPHEGWKKLIGRLIELLTLERDMDVRSLGSTTFKRADLAKGLEPDECYYLQHEAVVRDLDEIDLRRDPPPDLVVEVDVSHHDVDRQGIYAAMGVPELWRFDGGRLSFWVLDPAGLYRQQKVSLALPSLEAGEVQPFLDMRRTHSERQVMQAFREWLRSRPA